MFLTGKKKAGKLIPKRDFLTFLPWFLQQGVLLMMLCVCGEVIPPLSHTHTHHHPLYKTGASRVIIKCTK